MMDWFAELCTTERLTFSEIEAWGRITRRVIFPHEATLLKQLDSLFRRVQANGRSSSTN